jgi:hypothetical protein
MRSATGSEQSVSRAVFRMTDALVSWRAVAFSSLVEVREDGLPFAAFLGLALQELLDVLGLRLYLAG